MEGSLAALETELRAAVDADNLVRLLTIGDLPGDEQPVFHSLGFTEEDLAAISLAQAQGQQLPASPEQHGLTPGQLITLAEILALGADADASDRQRVVQLLVQAEKRRWLYPRWRAEEQADGITLSPTHFRQVPPSPTGSASPTGSVPLERQNAATQGNWRERLSAREEQHQLAIAGLRTAADRAEEAVLPGLRDALVDAVVTDQLMDPPAGLSVVERREQQRRWVTNTLLIDAFEGGCRTTTRIAQAVETIQLLLWGLRGKHLETGNIQLEPEHFDEDWQWLGGYATWRAAMFAFLYPENLLEPSLRPTDEQSELFRAIARVLRGDVPQARPAAQGNASSPTDGDGDATTAEHTEPEDPTGELAATVADRVLDVLNSGGRYRWTSWKSHIWMGARKGMVLVYDYAPGEVEYYLPMLFAVSLERQGRYDTAQDWFSGVIDARSGALTAPAAGFLDGLTTSPDHEREEGWLRDLNPHKLAATRAEAHLRYILIALVRCLLDHAEAEFTADTAESLGRARELYLTAQRLLESKPLKQHLASDGAALGRVLTEIGGSAWTPYIWAALSDAVGSDWRGLPAETWTRLRRRLSGVLTRAAAPRPSDTVRAELDSTIRDVLSAPPREPLQARLQQDQQLERNTANQLLSDTTVFTSLQLVDGDPVRSFTPRTPGTVIYPLERGEGWLGGLSLADPPRGSWIPAPRPTFCVPPNPLLIGLRLRLEIGLAKLRNCMNISGLYRELPAYGAPTDARSGAPARGSRGLIVLPPVSSSRGPPRTATGPWWSGPGSSLEPPSRWKPPTCRSWSDATARSTPCSGPATIQPRFCDGGAANRTRQRGRAGHNPGESSTCPRGRTARLLHRALGEGME